MVLLMSTRMCIICCAELIRSYYTGRKVTATALAEKYGLNIRTLNPSLNKMTRKGILTSQVGGVDRGYIFTKDPREITVYDVIDSVEGFSYMKNCKESILGSKCSISCEGCELYKTSKFIIDFAAEQYKKVTIYDLFSNEEAEAQQQKILQEQLSQEQSLVL